MKVSEALEWWNSHSKEEKIALSEKYVKQLGHLEAEEGIEQIWRMETKPQF